jgi:serine/threonine-protein kinase PRP4
MYPWDDENGYLKILRGDSIRNYEVTSIIGKGVFGSVIKCVETSSQREVAMKIIRSQKIYAISGERELQVLRQLNSEDVNGKVCFNRVDKKNIVKILEAFTHQKHLCMVMECFDINLRETFPKIARFPVPIATLQSYAQALLKTLYFLKKRGIIHADSKFCIKLSKT